MATLYDKPLAAPAGNERFFLGAAIAMTVVIVAGFSTQLGMGRSTFYSPPLVHAHAIIFMGWITIYLLQNILVTTDRMALHRRLGWVAAGWIVPMIVLGFAVTLAMVRRGNVPFFFQPLQFLVFDPLSLLAFAALTSSAIVLRNKTEWHRRLHLCGMAMLMGPGFGRLLPTPLLQPWAWEASFAAGLIFPAAGAVSDLRRAGQGSPRVGLGYGGSDWHLCFDRSHSVQWRRPSSLPRRYGGLARSIRAPAQIRCASSGVAGDRVLLTHEAC